MTMLDTANHLKSPARRKSPGIAMLATAALLGASLLAGAADARTVLKAAYGAQTSHPSFQALERMAQIVAERSGGELVLELYPERQLGEERETVEGLQFGSVDLTVVSTGPLLGFVPELAVLDLPFLFRDSQHAYAVLDGEIGRDLLDTFGDQQIVGLAWWENGWRNITAKKEIHAPADMRGVKIRTMQNPVHISYFQELGASPAPMAWGEVFTSLGQGIIESQENPISIIYFSSLWEVQSHLVLSRHVYGPHAVLFSKPTWDRLSESERQLISDAANEVKDFARQTSADMDRDLVSKLQEQGMTVVEPDTAPFQAIAIEFAGKQSGISAELVRKIAETGK